jgi:hypothetical protein
MTPDFPSNPEIPAPILDSLYALVEYLWQCEFQDFLDCPEQSRESHIFEHLFVVRAWLLARFGDRRPC